MPTGYTADITSKDISFQQFAMNCARAFGALITMRDEPSDAPIPEKFEPSPYHVKAHKDAVSELARLSQLSPDEQDALGAARKSKLIQEHKEWIARDAADNEKYLAMQRQVNAWTPPTKDHVELKSFMLQQIDISITHSTYATDSLAKLESRTPHSFYREALETAGSDIAYHAEQLDKEEKRCADRTEWVQKLRKSLEVR